MAANLSAQDKAAVLADALPWLERLRGATVVIKYGGNAMVDDTLKRAFAEDVVFLSLAGLRPVVVHGGGPQITNMLARLEIPSEFRGGLRVTTSEAMEVVHMVLTGQVQREIVSLINEHGPFAVGLSGDDAHLFTAERKHLVLDGEVIDLGHAGDVVDVNPAFVEALLDDGRIPVVSSVASDHNGTVYNVNADTAAGSLAVALGARKLVMLTDVEGVYANWPESTEVLRVMTAAQLRALLPNLSEGMAPKMEAALRAVDGGVQRAHVIDGRVAHALLVEVFTDEGVGTMIVADGETS